MPRFAANLSLMFPEFDFLDRFAAARSAGFDAVEVQFPYAHPTDEIAARLAGEGLRLVLHNLPAGDWRAGKRGIAASPGREEEFREGVFRAIEVATRLGCPQLNCLAGVPDPDVDHASAQATFVENLAFAAEALDEAGLRLLIEPINRIDVPGFHLSRTEDAIETIRAVGAPNLFVQFDAYHATMMGEDILGAVSENLAAIAHVQIADAPGRHEPGTGAIDFRALFDRLDGAGYDGFVACEYVPAGSTVEGLGWLKRERARGAASDR